MAERISGSDLYVTHEKMSSYLNQLLCGALGLVLTVIGATWYLSSLISEVRQDVAVIKVQLQVLNAAVVRPAGDVTQAQYVLVELPPTAAELENQTVRDVLLKQGFIDARTP